VKKVNRRPPVRGKSKPGARKFNPAAFSFKREAKWMTAINVAPLVIGIVLALIFWFTR